MHLGWYDTPEEALKISKSDIMLYGRDIMALESRLIDTPLGEPIDVADTFYFRLNDKKTATRREVSRALGVLYRKIEREDNRLSILESVVERK